MTVVTTAIVKKDDDVFYFASEDGEFFYEMNVEVDAEHVHEFLALREETRTKGEFLPMSFHRTFLNGGIGDSVTFTEIKVPTKDD